MGRFFVLFAFVATVSSSLLASANDLKIADGAELIVLDRSELEAFPQSTVVTFSPYFDGDETFSGPTLTRVLEPFDVSGERNVTLKALNDYTVTGPLREILGLDAIVATRRNGKVMSVRDRGPFWIILPLSTRPELDDENFHRYMVWQLNGIELSNR
ncbi:hypothetical protein [Marinobacter sp. M-5]|uniref:hypothetical protein n=1 Tax=Marinobacter sp. M-5 TaxID=3081089 RepID=UPI00293D03ED|nr:hypothetical protein [Marinobacter sp. M-5]MDV3504208.1 hypothetical protein [Marinobacter sp. M-5]